MKTINDYQVGDLLVFTQRSNRGEEKRAAVVTCINYKNNGLVTFGPPPYQYTNGLMDSGQGAFDPMTVGTKPFGFYCAVEKIGHLRQHRATAY